MHMILYLFLTFAFTGMLQASPVYTGYSGAPGRQTCASSCHGLSGGTVEIAGFPGEYVPDQTYLITIRRMSGLSIRNFNASVRRATGSVNAGLIASGDFTETYDVPGETNGVHLSTLDHDSATFEWTAPAVGTGVVRLYAGAYQGTSTAGHNTTIVLVSTEHPTLPEPATNPSPANSQTGVLPTAALQWTAGVGAETHDVYFGLVNPPPLLASYFEGTFFDPDPDLTPGATYYWRIDARNYAGVTEGELWQFTVMNLPGASSNPLPEDMATGVQLPVFLEWTPGAEAASHDVYIGTSPDTLVFDANVQTPTHEPGIELLPGESYYWRVDERNDVGIAPGEVWSFTMEASSADEDVVLPAQYTLGPLYPNPFNAAVTIPFTLAQAGMIRLSIVDLLGREVAVLASGNLAAGDHSVAWETGRRASGIYIVRLEYPHGILSQKITALK